MEYIKFGTELLPENKKSAEPKYRQAAITSKRNLQSTVRTIRTTKAYPKGAEKEVIQNTRETEDDINKFPKEWESEDTFSEKPRDSVLTRVLCGLMASMLMFIGVYLSEIPAPQYMEKAIMELVARAEQRVKVKAHTVASENYKTIGAKVLVEVMNKGKEDNEEVKSDGENTIKTENPSFAQIIRSEGTSETNEDKGEDINGQTETKDDKTVQVIAKNMSKGSDKLYFTNKTNLEIDINDLVKREYPIEKLKFGTENQPEVLIIHTHGTEAYINTSDSGNSRSKNTAKNIVRVGEELANVLRAYGISVIHSKTMHDEISYVNSYASSKKEAEDYLEKYPTIKYIIDVHRDALGTEESPVKTYTEINGVKTAQLMFVMGTNAAGGDHPNFKENLTTASHIQQTTNKLYPTLMRPMSIRPIIFNQNLTMGSMILEVGSDANTLEEAIAAVRMFGRCFAECVGG